MVDQLKPATRPMTSLEKVQRAVEELGKIKIAYNQNIAMVRFNPKMADADKDGIILGLEAAITACDIAIDTLTYTTPCPVLLPPATEMPVGIDLPTLIMAMEMPTRTKRFSSIVGIQPSKFN